MADNIDVTPGTGKTVAADEIAGALHQRVKVTLGINGVDDGDLSATNPMPVDATGQGDVPITLDGEAVVLGAGTAAFGKLAANTGVDIGDVDVLSVAGTVTVDATGQGDVPISLDGEAVVLGAGTAGIGKLTANSGVDIGDVDVLSIAAGENFLGLTGPSNVVVTVTASLDTNIYAAGDVLFDTQAIAGAARTSGGVVILQSVTVLDKDDQGVAMDLVFLDAATSLGTENAVVDISDAGAEDILGVVNIATGDYTDLIAHQVATVSNIGLEMQADASTALYVAGVTRGGTPTHSASGLMIKFAFSR